MPAEQQDPRVTAHPDTVSGVELTASIENWARDRGDRLQETAQQLFAGHVDRNAPERQITGFLIDALEALADEMRELRHETDDAK